MGCSSGGYAAVKPSTCVVGRNQHILIKAQQLHARGSNLFQTRLVLEVG